MKKLEIKFLFVLILLTPFLFKCQDEKLELISSKSNGESRSVPTRVGGKIPNPGGHRIIPPNVIKQEFNNATAWKISWEDINFDNDNWQKYAGIFSLKTGSVHSIHYLNNTDPQNTANVDMFLLFESVYSPSSSIFLTHQAIAKNTLFKRSDMTVGDLEDITINDPSLFQTAFETEPYQIESHQPISGEDGASSMYDPGDIYTFKTDDPSPKYGAIRIVQISNPAIIEVVVQKDVIGGFKQ